MTRKPFGWTPDDDEPEAPPVVRRATREERVADARRAQELAEVLVTLPPTEWPHLGLEEIVVEALAAYRSIPSVKGIARRRQFRRLATLMATEDLDALEVALGSGRKGHTERQERVQALERAMERLVVGGKEAQAAFVDAHPSTERQRLRQLVGNVRKAKGDAAEKRARKKLLDLLLSVDGL